MENCKIEDRIKYSQTIENLLKNYGYKLKENTKKLIETIALDSHDFFEFLTKLGVEYEISEKLESEPSLLINKDNNILFFKFDGDNVVISDLEAKETILDSKEDNFYGYTIVKITNINTVYINLSNSIHGLSSILFKNKLYSLSYVTIYIILSILIYIFLMNLRITIDTYLYYKNVGVISLVLSSTFILFVIIFIINKLRILTLQKFYAKESLFNQQDTIHSKNNIIVSILFKWISLPCRLVCYLFILYTLNINLFYFALYSVLLIYTLVYIIKILQDNIKVLRLFNRKNAISFIIYSAIIALILIYTYINICLFFHDTISLGIIIMSVGIYAINISPYFNILEDINQLNKVKQIANVAKLNNFIKDQYKNVKDFDFDIKIKYLNVNNKLIFKNIFLEKNSINLFYGPTSSGKTLLARTLSGQETKKGSNILIGNQPLSMIRKKNIQKIIACIDNTSVNYSSIDNLNDSLTINTKKDVSYIFKSLNIYHLKKDNDYLITDTEKVIINIAMIILKNYYVIIFDNVLSRLDNEESKQILNLCRQLKILVIVMEQKNIINFNWDQVIKIQEGQ